MSIQTPTTCVRNILLALFALTLVFACFVPAPENDTPQQGWWAERGPVVPHDNFPSDCSLCHEAGGWQTIRADFVFDHAAETGTALDGAHATAECLRCHNDRGPVERFADRGCTGCHEDIHQGQLGQGCADCHSERDWRPDQTIADHNRTRFPLVGSHAAIACYRCHAGADVGQFIGTDVECISCHGSELVTATASGQAPDHMAQGWTSNCDECHIPTTWSGGGFNHPGFNLTGAHKVAACASCHVGGVYSGLPTDCFTCHTAEYSAAPDHVADSYPLTCESCHGTSTWQGALFNHAAAGISTGCNACHASDFAATTAPDHNAMGLSTACESCHQTHMWVPSTFAHAGISTDCASCHIADYNATTDPNHIAEGFSTSCEDCHGSTTTWQGASFNHTGIVDNCVTCHISDYNATTDPDHLAAMFPTSCESCHTSTTNWYGAVFDHQFPITSGKHKNFDCVECHTNPGTFIQFSCIDCHEHSKSKMDDKHSGESGYIYTSAACYSCHPNGKE